VVVRDGTVYAAAGIAHYDGTYVFALNAVTGDVKWCNDTSGRLSEEVDCGVSLQGELYIADGELRFLGGGKYEIARYDLETGRSLNEPDNSIASRFRTAYYPYYPDYGRYVSLAHKLADGRELIYDASYEGSEHSGLALFAALPAGAARPALERARWPLNRRGPRRESLWADQGQALFNAFVASPGTLLAAGHTGAGDAEEPFLAAIDVSTGKDQWREPLPAAAVRAGAAIDAAGRIVLSLENGQVMLWAK
jgi:outer membrane protein assembly factor BamB